MPHLACWKRNIPSRAREVPVCSETEKQRRDCIKDNRNQLESERRHVVGCTGVDAFFLSSCICMHMLILGTDRYFLLRENENCFSCRADGYR